MVHPVTLTLPTIIDPASEEALSGVVAASLPTTSSVPPSMRMPPSDVPPPSVVLCASACGVLGLGPLLLLLHAPRGARINEASGRRRTKEGFIGDTLTALVAYAPPHEHARACRS